MSGLEERLRKLAATPVLLVACDFDGTLAPIADHPHGASATPRAWAALERLAALPHTHAAVVSGRARDDLAERVGGAAAAAAAGIALVGSHGLEVGAGPVWLDHESRAGLAELDRIVEAEAAQFAGAVVERKPASVTFHYRMIEPELASGAVERVLAAVKGVGAGGAAVHTLRGDMVLEFCIRPPNKGAAVGLLRHRVGATGVLFIGDDVTDEAAFAALTARELGIKVGAGSTVATVSVDDQAVVPGVLEELLARRESWLGARSVTPIERHSALSDGRTVLLLDPEGSVVWGCFPRIDSTPMFAALLGRESDGVFSVRPIGGDGGGGERPARQAYEPGSMVLRTEWDAFAVVDYLDCTGGRPFQRAGRSELVRTIEPVAGGAGGGAGGGGRALVRFAPRLDFGRTPTRLVVREGGLEIDGWHEPVVLRSPGVAWRIVEDGVHQTAEAEIDLTQSSGPVTLELRFGTASLAPTVMFERARREGTLRFWSGWAATLELPTLRPDLVKRSALAIKALCYGPSGAISAAATTSLPEHLGGVRNWDYRYCWVRDACMSASALARLGNTGTGLKMVDWLVEVVRRFERAERLRPLYTVTGDELGSEAEINEVCGYAESRPVRVGNAASQQVQLDVFGPVVELVALLAERGAPVTPEAWRLVEAMVKAVEARWREPDHGIWEIRGPKRHHTHTKAMCWLAVDRGLMVAEGAMGAKRPMWAALREEIAADVLSRGWCAELPAESGGGGGGGAFTAAYGETTLDSSVLLVGLCGLVAPTDERFIATVRAVERALREGPVVHRYRGDDGLPGREGGWLICAAWLAESLWLIGEKDRALEVFEGIANLAGPTGLMAEEFDPRHGIALGNFPQAYSHLGFINAAVRLGAG